MTFHERLTSETVTARERFLAIPLVRHAPREGASKALYLAFLREAYHHVKHTFPLLALAASRTEDERYRDALMEYMQEERGHEKWILDDIRVMGGNADAVREGTPGEACRIMVAFGYYAIEHVSPHALLGSIHVLEGMSVLLANGLADTLRHRFGTLGLEGLSYLTSHGSLDVEHVSFFRTFVNGIEDEETRRLVIDHSKIFYRLYGDIFREIGAMGGIEYVD